jgi:CBS domain-containing protein
MQVQDIMTRTPVSCSTRNNLGEVASVFFMRDFGSMPVVDRGRVIGMITDRDICIAAATRGKAPGEILAGDVMSSDVAWCAPEDDVHEALATMERARVRRLPVVGGDGLLCGLITMNDLLLAAHPESDGERPLTDEEVMSAFRTICRHSRVALAAAV